MKISVIIPTLNEGQCISKLIDHLKVNGGELLQEIVVSDAGSSDNTTSLAQSAGATTISCSRGRAIQMNDGAAIATGDILYFVHADCFPPPSFAEDICAEIRKGQQAGCFRFKFNSTKRLLRINAYCTRFKSLMFRGGDQSLFIRRDFFEEIGKFNESLKIMEDYDLIRRIRKKSSFRIIPRKVIVSARKYDTHNYLVVNLTNLIVFQMYRLGCSQDRMLKTYYRFLRISSYKPW